MESAAALMLDVSNTNSKQVLSNYQEYRAADFRILKRACCIQVFGFGIHIDRRLFIDQIRGMLERFCILLGKLDQHVFLEARPSINAGSGIYCS